MAARVTFKISDKVREELQKAEIGERSVKLVGRVDRKLYNEINKVLEGAGGTWSRKAGAHVFESDPRELLGLAIETGVATNKKTELQAFYTPDLVAARVAELAEIPRPSARSAGRQGLAIDAPLVLEPSIGGAALAYAVWKKNPFARVIGFDVDPVAIQKLEALSKPTRILQVFQMDFLEVKPGETEIDRVDRVVMNPPFTKDQDAKHIVHAFSFLRRGGILVAVMPAGVSCARRPRSELRDLFYATNAHLEPCAEGAFRESGTNVRTQIVKMVRK